MSWSWRLGILTLLLGRSLGFIRLLDAHAAQPCFIHWTDSKVDKPIFRPTYVMVEPCRDPHKRDLPNTAANDRNFGCKILCGNKYIHNISKHKSSLIQERLATLSEIHHKNLH